MRWLRQLFSRRRLYSELSEMIREHIEEKTADLMDNGMQYEDAVRAAYREFGNVTLIEERSREVWRWSSIENFIRDLHFSLRIMMRNPGFTAVVLLSLSLGIASTTTIFSAMYGVVVAPPLNNDAKRLVILWESNKIKDLLRSPVAPATFRDWLESSRSFEGLELVAPGSPVTVTGSKLPERANIQYATPGLFSLLGVQPVLGRSFEASDINAANSVVLSDSFWNRHFARNRTIIGQQITINGTPQTVVGVLPPDFHLFDRDTDLWMPIDRPSAQSQDRAFRSWLIAVGKLRSNVTLASAQNEMNFLADRIAKAHPDTNKDWGVKIERLQEAQFGYWNKILYLLLGIVGCVLLISCTNVANLLLGRLTTRGREFCLRASLGASKTRLVRQLLTEGLFLGVAASILGCPLAYAGIRLFRFVAPANFPLLRSIQINLPVLLFTVAISVLSGIAAMVTPALFAARLDVNGMLKSNGQTAVGRAHGGFRKLLVVTEIALSLVLLSGAGLMINSVLRLLRVNPGFDARGVTTMEMFLAGPKYFEFGASGVRIHRSVDDFYRQLIERTSAIPGVESVGIVSWLPEMGYNTGRRERGFQILGQRSPDNSEQPSAAFNLVSADYFRTLRISLLRGRIFDSHDNADAPSVAVVNEAFLRRFLPQGNPIGQQIIIDNGPDEHPRQIVGIVGDVRQNSLDESATPEIFVPYLQEPNTSSAHGYQNRVHMTIILRSSLESANVATAVRRIAASMDSSQPVYGIRSMSEVLAESTSIRRLYANLLEIISGIALFLSMIGIYGVMSHAVAQRTNEIGLRMAVGATISDIVRLVFLQGGRLVASGLAAGLTLALVLDRFLTAYLFGITAYDPITMGACCAVLLLVMSAAIWIPARRASHIDPLIALRYE